jgi:serine/threonine protein kinase
MKVLKKSEVVRRRQVEHTKTERRIMGGIDHPFVVALRFAFQTADKLYMVTDYCRGGELFFHLKRFRTFPEPMVRFFAAELVCALGHLHSINVVYRDLKPENVLLDAEGHVHITDFGLSRDDVVDPRGAQGFNNCDLRDIARVLRRPRLQRAVRPVLRRHGREGAAVRPHAPRPVVSSSGSRCCCRSARAAAALPPAAAAPRRCPRRSRRRRCCRPRRLSRRR